MSRALAERTEGGAIVTLGARGAVMTPSGRPSLWVTLPGEPGAYPVGSGDAFLAGLATAILGGRPIEDALRLASGAAAANARVPGAGRLDAAEAVRLADLVRIEPALG